MGSLDHIIVSHSGLLSRLCDLMQPAVPASWIQFLRGPRTQITIPECGATPRVRSSWRPIVLRIGSPLVLTKRLSIPRVGRGEIRHAIDLMIRTETPFDPKELFIDAFPVAGPHDEEHCAYQVRMLPREQVNAALKQLKIRPGDLAEVALEGHKLPFHRAAIDRRSSTALRRHIGWVVPMVTLAWLGTTAVVSELGAGQAVVHALQLELETEAALLRRASAVLVELHDADARYAQIDDYFRTVPPTSDVLLALKATLPATISVSRIEYRDGQYRLSVSTPDVLGDLRDLQDALLQPVSLGGPVSDSDGGQQATIVLATRQP